uniref:Uncharacterized protein n=1 Tax=candidate division WOR-3 bacterium TaxID=2052148 RepID=A0A7C3UPM6_UNCW3
MRSIPESQKRRNMAQDNKKYVELLWHQKYDKLELGEKIPIEKPNLPFQVVETINEPRAKDLKMKIFANHPANYPKDWKNLLIWGDIQQINGRMNKEAVCKKV